MTELEFYKFLYDENGCTPEIHYLCGRLLSNHPVDESKNWCSYYNRDCTIKDGLYSQCGEKKVQASKPHESVGIKAADGELREVLFWRAGRDRDARYIAVGSAEEMLVAHLQAAVREAEIRGMRSVKSRMLRRTEIPTDAKNPTRDFVVILGEEIAGIIQRDIDQFAQSLKSTNNYAIDAQSEEAAQEMAERLAGDTVDYDHLTDGGTCAPEVATELEDIYAKSKEEGSETN